MWTGLLERLRRLRSLGDVATLAAVIAGSPPPLPGHACESPARGPMLRVLRTPPSGGDGDGARRPEGD